MSALERLIEECRIAFAKRVEEANASYERQARAEIRAMAESRRRSIGQRIRFIAARLAAQRGGSQ